MTQNTFSSTERKFQVNLRSFIKLSFRNEGEIKAFSDGVNKELVDNSRTKLLRTKEIKRSIT